MTRRRLRTIGLVSVCLLAQWSAAQQPPPVSDAIEKMGTNDADQVRAGRNAILEAIKRDPSVAGKQKLNDEIMGRLKDYANGQSDLVATNALRVAGDLATADAVKLVGDKLKDPRDAIRLFSAMEVGRIMEGLDSGTPALDPSAIRDLVAATGAQLAVENNSFALDADVRGLIKAAGVNRAGFETVRHAALKELCSQIAARERTLPGWPQAAPFIPALLRAQTELRAAQNQSNPQLKLTQAEDAGVVEMSLHLLGWVVTHIKDFENVPAQDRRQISQMVQVAEQTVMLGADKYGVKVLPQQLTELFLQATAQGDREFFQKAVDLITRMEGEPFKVKGVLKK
jgi:hypothetical protein